MANKPVVVGKDIQTRQRKLKAKMVKASYERHYIRDPCRAQREGGHSRVIVIFKKKSQHESKTLRKEEKRKKKRKLETRKENREIEWQTCTNRLILSLSLYKPYPLPKTK